MRASRTSHGPLLAVALCALAVTAALLGAFRPDGAAPDRPALLQAQDATPPVADAGGNMTAYVGFEAVLNGSGSSDNLGIADYTWTIWLATPVVLTGETAPHTFSSAGEFDVTLNVTDHEGNWDVDAIVVTVVEDLTPPVSHAGYSRNVTVGAVVDMSARLSADPQTGISNYTWNLTHRGVPVLLYGREVEFVFEEPGTYLVTLTVTNGVGLTNTSSIVVVAREPPTWLSQNWTWVAAALVTAGVCALEARRRLRKNGMLLTNAEREKLGLRVKELRRVWGLLRANTLGFAGTVVLTVFILMAVFAPVISTVQDPNLVVNHEQTLEGLWDNPSPPSLDPSPYTGFRHPLGTDSIGQDVYSLTLYGARASLLVGFVATAISIVLGVAIGLVAGYFGKLTDEILMRFTDYFLVLPWFPLMIVLMTVLGQEFVWVIVVIGITSWPSTARIVRSQVLTVKERAFIERARAIGAGDMYIMRRHVFPNVLPLVFANTVLLISLAIFSEAFLDFFGLGDPDVISWGTMLEAAYSYGAFDSGSWWWVLPPSLSIILCVLAFSLVGYALDDIFNPRLRKR
ncbi:MAG: ABC transporter permease subunit [Candidatus Thermoplasmatota archaeon]